MKKFSDYHICVFGIILETFMRVVLYTCVTRCIYGVGGCDHICCTCIVAVLPPHVWLLAAALHTFCCCADEAASYALEVYYNVLNIPMEVHIVLAASFVFRSTYEL